MNKTKIICFEGIEGTGKSTQAKLLANHLRSKGYKVLETKEPGTSLSPLTMSLREIMLNAKYDNEMTKNARELISQAIRSIHLEKVIYPAMGEYDFIIQDRGILSGYSYGEACGNDFDFLYKMTSQVLSTDTKVFSTLTLYDHVIYLKGDSKKGLERARSCKQEFAEGDAMENKGNSFMEEVSKNMDKYSSRFNTIEINIDDKDIDQVFNEILGKIEA